ncbi:hypothetical protein CALCODRAFT_316471 [Calocera cornea HHB12733]|uniref:Uncharacterized protein n=1 Tax=Calocera cornea HHB12733 TaxID=1353952 RepID=A0A165FAZ2_9BASI|nr:hypothetical protein CALCODRAFT_316471 [Calocera cornea HHB12733]
MRTYSSVRMEQLAPEHDVYSRHPVLENLPVDPAHAANILAWTMPGVHWSRGKLGHSVSAFLTARVRLLRIAHEHAKDITYAKATRLGLARSLSLRYKWRKEALKIVEEAIKDGDVSAYAAKAFCLKMGWRQTRDPTTKKRLASQRVDALEQGMEQGDCQCAKELASLLVQGRIVAKDETRAKKCLERAVASESMPDK